MLKRVALNSNDEQARYNLKYQNLLQDYLELQKKFVSDKKKLPAAKQKRGILLDEVEFLRKRCRFLLDMQSKNLLQQEEEEEEEDLVPPGSSSSKQTENGGEVLIGKKMVKKPKNGVIINGKKIKKKISWQDHSTVMEV